MDSRQQSRYLNLKSKLAELNYTGLFSIDAVDVVEYLVKDLSTITSSYKNIRDKETRLSADLALAQAQLFPLRKENAKLARDSHQLHLDNIILNDKADALLSEHELESNRMDDKLSELKYLIKLRDEELKQSEKENIRIRDAFNQHTSKNQGTSNRKPIIQLSENLKEQITSTMKLSNSNSSNISQLHNNSDSQLIESLRQQLDASNNRVKKVELENKRLHASITVRENELVRTGKHLTALGDTESNLPIPSRMDQLAAADESNRRIIDQLNSQIDFLNEVLSKVESQLIEATDKIGKTDSLELELQQANRLLENESNVNKRLNIQVVELEKRVFELSESIDPDGSISIESLFDRTSSVDDVSIDMNINNQINNQKSNSITNSARNIQKSNLISIPSKKSRIIETSPIHNNKKPSNITNKTNIIGKKSISNIKEISSKGENKDMENEVIANISGENHGLMNNILVLSDTVSGLNKGDLILKERLKRSDELISGYKIQITELQQQLQSYAYKCEDNDMIINQLENNLLSEKSKSDELHSKLNEKFDNNVELEGKTLRIEQILEDNIRENNKLNEMIDNLKSELYILKKEKVEVTIARDVNVSRLMNLEKEIVLSRNNLERMSKELTEKNMESSNLRFQVEELSNKFTYEQSKNESMRRIDEENAVKYETNLLQLNESLRKISILEMTLSNSNLNEQIKTDNSQLKLKNIELEEDKMKLIREKNIIESKMSSILTEAQTNSSHSNNIIISNIRRECQEELNNKENEINEFKHIIKTIEFELETVSSKLTNQDDICVFLKKTISDREKQINSCNKDNSQLRSDIKLLEVQLEESNQECLKSQYFGDDITSARIFAIERAEKAENELKILLDKNIALRNDSDKLEHICETLKRQFDVLSKKSISEREDFKRSLSINQKLEAQISDLKILVTNAEATSRSYSQRSARLTVALEQGDEGIKKVEEENIQLRDLVASKESMIYDLQVTLQNIDEDRDRLQSQLDSEEEDAINRSKHQQTLDNDIIKYKQIIERCEKKISNQNLEIQSAQKQCLATEARLNSLKEENLQIKRIMIHKNSEVGSASEDLMLMTKENQAITSELIDITGERDRLRHRISEVIEAISTIEQSRRATELEKNDLLESYRAVLQEKRRLESELHALKSVRDKASVSVQQLHEQVAELKGLTSANSAAEARFVGERASMSKQISLLNEELVNEHKKTDSIEADNRRMIQDMHGLKQTNTMLNERIQLIIKRASDASDANKVLSSRLLSVERERNAMRALVSVERQRATEMGQVAETARSQAANRDVQMQRMRLGASNNDISVNSTTSLIRKENDIISSTLSSSPLLIKKSTKLNESSLKSDSSNESDPDKLSESLGINDEN